MPAAAGVSVGGIGLWLEQWLDRIAPLTCFLKDAGLSPPDEGEGVDFNRWLTEGENAGQPD